MKRNYAYTFLTVIHFLFIILSNNYTSKKACNKQKIRLNRHEKERKWREQACDSNINSTEINIIICKWLELKVVSQPRKEKISYAWLLQEIIPSSHYYNNKCYEKKGKHERERQEIILWYSHSKEKKGIIMLWNKKGRDLMPI